jgi:hypothetical protein
MKFKTNEVYEAYFATKRKLYEALKVKVGIDVGEVLKVVVTDLIGKRNAARELEVQRAFDLILRKYYLTEEEFQKYVIKEDPIV